MRASAILLAFALLPLAGCMSDGEGRFVLHVTDAPDNIGDFASLNVTVERIVLSKKTDAGVEGGSVTHAPATSTFDLTKLTNGNVSTIFRDGVEAGSYGKLTLHVANATGVLLDGTTVAVKAPSGRLFLNTDFTIEEGQETEFLFDIQVHRTGNGEYQFKPNADGSGPGKKPATADAKK